MLQEFGNHTNKSFSLIDHPIKGKQSIKACRWEQKRHKQEVQATRKGKTSLLHLVVSWLGNEKRGKGRAFKVPQPIGTHQVEESPEQGLYLGCSHGWYRGCTPDSRWVGGYGCSVLACSMESFREGEQKFNEDTKLTRQVTFMVIIDIRK